MKSRLFNHNFENMANIFSTALLGYVRDETEYVGDKYMVFNVTNLKLCCKMCGLYKLKLSI
jgi:hypothetical protein